MSLFGNTSTNNANPFGGSAFGGSTQNKPSLFGSSTQNTQPVNALSRTLMYKILTLVTVFGK